MNKKTLIICAVFALIISCKNFAIKDLEQKTKGQINGFVDKILDPTKDKITSNGTKVDELAKKLQEEDEDNELMQGDDPNNGVINPPPVLPASSQDNAPGLKAEQQSGGQQEEQAKVRKEDKGKGEKAEDRKEKQEDKEGSDKEKEEVEEQNKGKKQEAKKEAKEKQEREELQKRQQEEQQRKAKEEAEKEAKAEQEREEKQKQEEEKKVKDKLKNLVDKIAKINGDIDGIKGKTSVGAKEVRDKITGPIYDDFTDGSSSIRTIWEDLEDEEDFGLGKLLKELSDTRGSLRTKLNVGNQPYIIDTRRSEPQLKENVSVSEIKSDLEELKSKLEKVKSYLEDSSKFEEIKGYINGNGYDDED
ncbi:Erp24 protein [Borreliella burgdorferi]|uniref:Erp24 protein n=1 Tax=Borreliella burgdorferi TaxID=139 RepID=UPI00016B2AEE|nr:Erp24 protein [Borreliella burgdorferi]ACL34074.1 Erp24 protein [Borreliella burgdorferi 156a]MDK7384225.1 ErpC protein [Borreliella burgdorferi]PRQ93281.1 ErpC protein [Borreliella burgdorferi]PRR05961.1 ErpC protein [Borreliella burgdorferi]PRR24344.1 ErpC protein [Borreliella burgdorferi]